MKHKKLTIVAALSLLSSNIHATGLPVFDLAGHSVKVLSYIKQYQEFNMMLRRIEYEYRAVQRLKTKLANWQFKDFNSINDLVRHYNNFKMRSRSIGYTYNSIEREFDEFYGKKGSSNKNYSAWQKQSDDSIKDAMMAQGRLEKSQHHMADLDKVVTDKRGDHDQAATLQSIGEINAIQSKQMADLTEVVATDARAKQSVMMEKRAKEKAQQEHDAHLMQDFNKHEKSRPMTHFPSVGGGNA